MALGAGRVVIQQANSFPNDVLIYEWMDDGRLFVLRPKEKPGGGAIHMMDMMIGRVIGRTQIEL